MSLSASGVNSSASTDQVSSIFLICFSMFSSFCARSTISLQQAQPEETLPQHAPTSHWLGILPRPFSFAY